MNAAISRGHLHVAGAVLCAAAAGCTDSPREREVDEHDLLALHYEVLDAHRTNDVDAWMAVEDEDYVSANNGTVTFPTKDERRAWRAPYLASTTFETYQDARPPIVRISQDGTLGWVIAEVEMRGAQRGEDGVERAIDAVWAWIELYEKRSGSWRLVGNVANRREEAAGN